MSHLEGESAKCESEGASCTTVFKFSNIDEFIHKQSEFNNNPDTLKKVAFVENHIKSLGNLWIAGHVKKKKVIVKSKSEQECRIYSFGSYHFGCNFTSGSIDLVLVAPSFMEHLDFLTEFRALISNKNSGINDIRTIHADFRSHLKFQIIKFTICLYFAKVPHIATPLPEVLKLKQSKRFDRRDLLAIKAVCLCDEILNSQPNKETYKQLLKVIRLWAHRKGILNSRLGFMNGIAWSILVAKVCQLYGGEEQKPRTLSELVLEFFRVYSEWQWPNPVILWNKEKQYITASSYWRPDAKCQIVSERQFYLMPVILPGSMALNTTAGLTKSSASIILRELIDAYKLVKEIRVGNLTWDTLFKEADYFVHRHYLLIQVKRGNIESSDHNKIVQFLEDCELAERALCKLCSRLNSNPSLELVHPSRAFAEDPLPRSTSESEGSVSKCESTMLRGRRWFIGLQFRKPQPGEKLTIDLSSEISDFDDLVAKLGRKPKCPESITIDYLKRRDLPLHLSRCELKAAKSQLPKSQPVIDICLNQSSADDNEPFFMRRRNSSTTEYELPPNLSTSGSRPQRRLSVCCDDWTDFSIRHDDNLDCLSPKGISVGSSVDLPISSGTEIQRKRSISSSQEEDDIFGCSIPAKRLSLTREDSTNCSEGEVKRSLGVGFISEEYRSALERKRMRRQAYLTDKNDDVLRDAFIRSEFDVKQALLRCRHEWFEAVECPIVLSLLPATNSDAEHSTKGRRSSLDAQNSVDSSTSDQTNETPVVQPQSLSSLLLVKCAPFVLPTYGEGDCPVAMECSIVQIGSQKCDALGKVCLVDYQGRVLYDVFCSHNEPITNYRTHATGLKPFNAKSAYPLHHIQEKVKGIIKDRKIVGHNLEKMWQVLRIAHPQELQRDTALCLNLRANAGLPLVSVDVGLLSLAALLLDKNLFVQHGRTAQEDARVSMDLYKLIEREWECDLAMYKQIQP